MSQSTSTKGTLYIVATPIGNLLDISFRAIEILKSVDGILAEDTRHSAPLLRHYSINTPIQSYHSHNEAAKSQSILTLLCQGKSFALISDAGTPLISDPGFLLVRLARENAVTVVPVPGACALICALQAAGVPCHSFSFLGFLPAKKQARLEKLQQSKDLAQTLIYYESTHRIVECIQDIEHIMGQDFAFVMVKELTKTHETFVHGNAATLLQWLKGDPHHIKGEFVLILPPVSEAIKPDYEHVLQTLLDELPLKQAVSISCKLLKMKKNELYPLALSLENQRKL